jgi:3,4-dihydroxy 2-butanone 4-phosphate synthase/GTP cyclohydrolase II
MTETAARFPFDPIERAVSEIAMGRPVVVVDDADRENEGDLVMSELDNGMRAAGSSA